MVETYIVVTFLEVDLALCTKTENDYTLGFRNSTSRAGKS